MNSKNCLQCGIVFYKPTTESKTNWINRHKFCSRECVNKYQIGKKHSESHIVKVREKLLKSYRDGTRKKIEYSSELRKRMGMSHIGHEPWNKGLKGCFTDETLDKMSKSHIGNIPSRTFPKGNVPWNKGKAFIQMRGEHHWNWQGGKPKKDRRGEISYEEYLQYRDWQRSVFVRDNWTCQHCKTRGGKLHAHHIEPYASNTKRRWDIDNGLTLCPLCHRKTDSYGRKSMSCIQPIDTIIEINKNK